MTDSFAEPPGPIHFLMPDTTALQVPAARGACLLPVVARLGAFFNPKRRKNLRLYLTAGVSVADVGSDVFSLSVNYLAGNTGLASALLATVLLSMSVQILIVFVVHRHHGKRRLVLEILFVITGLKPFVDTWRILNGTANVGSPVDAPTERIGCEMAEIVCESVPTALIQMHDLLGATKLSVATVFSIIMSGLSIATITTGMFFDYDTDPAKRMHSPMFYGVEPDSTICKLLVRVRCVPRPPCGSSSSSGAFVQVSVFLFVLAHAMGKLTTITLPSRRVQPRWQRTFVAPWLCSCSTSSLAATSSIGCPPLGPACHWSGESLASFTLTFPEIPSSGTQLR